MSSFAHLGGQDWEEGTTPPHPNPNSTALGFLDGLGFQGHPEWRNIPSLYDPLPNWQRTVDLMVECGVRGWLRTEQAGAGWLPVSQGGTGGLYGKPGRRHPYFDDNLDPKIKYCTDKGIPVTFRMGVYDDPPHNKEEWFGNTHEILDKAIHQFGPGGTMADNAIIALESTNEPDLFNSAGGAWPGFLADWQIHQRQEILARPEVAHLPYWGSSYVYGNLSASGGSYGQAKAAYDQRGVDPKTVYTHANYHDYMGGSQPTLAHLDSQRTGYEKAGRGTPAVSTEWGFHTALQLAAGHGHRPVDERTQASYLIRQYLNHRVMKIEHSSFYICGNHSTDTTNSEHMFGIIRTDYTVKPAWHAFKAMTGMLGARALPPVRGNLGYQLVTQPPILRHHCVQRADGRYVLFLWREVSVWDRDARTPIAVGPGLTRLGNLPANAPVEVLRPVDGPTAASGAVSSDGFFELDVRGDPVLLLV